MISLPDETLLTENASKRMPDLRVRIIFYIFCGNAIFSFGTLLLGAIPYFYYLGLYWTHNGLFISLAAWVILYLGLAFSTSRMYLRVVMGFGLLWWIATSAVVGFLSATIYNISPIQFMAISMSQSVAMIIYTVQSPHHVETMTCGVLLSLATVIALLFSIYTFTVENDWIASGCLVFLGIALGAYNLMAIQRTEDRYDASWEQSVRAIAEYFCFDLIEKLGT